MRFRPAGVTDLIAAKAKYHKKCLIAYKYLSGKSKKETQKTDIAMILSALSSTMLPSVNKYSSCLTYGWGIIHTNTAVVYYLMRGSWKKVETCSNSPSHWPGTFLACEQALLFGQAKRASRERFAARSCVLARLVSLAQKGELARRLGHFREREPLLV